MTTLVYVSRRRQFGRPRRTIFPPAQPANLAWRDPVRPLIRRRLRYSFVRPKFYPGNPPQPPPPTPLPGAGRTQFLYYVSRKLRVRPARRLLPPVLPPPPVGLPGAGRTQFLYYVSRSAIARFLFARQTRRHLFGTSITPPPPPGNTTDYILRARRRGRR